MTIKEIQDAIEEWEIQKHNPVALEYLTSGFGFEFPRIEYDAWNKKPASDDYYIYLGIHEKQLLFFISSQHAKNIINENQVIISKFYQTTNKFHKIAKPSNTSSSLAKGSHFSFSPDNLPKAEAMTRVTNWLLCNNYWYNYYRNNNLELVSYFIVPKIDMDVIFDKNQGNAFKIICLFALNFHNVPYTTISNYIELLFTGESHGGSTSDSSPSQPKFTVYEDVTVPSPPF